jgi:hypothetical protein
MTSGAPYTWISFRYKSSPKFVNTEVVQQYAHAYMWYVVSQTLFANHGGRNAPLDVAGGLI